MADDIRFAGRRGFDALRDAPHARPSCLEHRWRSVPDARRCAFCFCYVCDAPASACAEWDGACARACQPQTCGSHCHASTEQPRWIAARAQAKRRAQAAELEQARGKKTPRMPTQCEHDDESAERSSFADENRPGRVDPQRPGQNGVDGEDLAGEDEEAEELFETYRPKHWTLGGDHPDPVVETTSLAFVDPPSFNRAPEEVLPGIGKRAAEHGVLSSLQLEAVAYACIRHETRLPDGTTAGFFIGDGPGVGKGRQLAAIVLENWLAGRKRHVWLSVSADLFHDAKRDMYDIMDKLKIDRKTIPMLNLTTLSYNDIHAREGLIFSTYAGLVSHEGLKAAEREVIAAEQRGDGAARTEAARAASSHGSKRTRLGQLIKWMEGDGSGNGCILFDECHKAKHLLPSTGNKSTLTGQAVHDLQQAVPRARVVYCSATGASSVKNMAYMVRLGLWGESTCFEDFTEFERKIDRAGYGAMELVALDMKQRGMYLSRALSYRDASFETVPVELTDEQKRMYDRAAQFWQMLQECFELAIEQLDECEGWEAPKHCMAQFWGAHQRFFRQLCMSIKVPFVVRLAEQARADGKCVVIGLQTTGEARLKEALSNAEEDLEDFSGLQALVEHLIETQFPTRGEQSCEGDEKEKGGPPRPCVHRRPNVPQQPEVNERDVCSSSSDSEVDFRLEAKAQSSAIASMSAKVERLSMAELCFTLEAFGCKKYKIPSGRDDRVRKVIAQFRELHEKHGHSQLRRKLRDLGVKPSKMPKSKVELVDRVWHLTRRAYFKVLEESGSLSGDIAQLALGNMPDGDDDDDDLSFGASSPTSETEDVASSAQQLMMCKRLKQIKDELLFELNSLDLPDNPLDELIHQLGGGEKVAELTGRKQKLVYEHGRPKAVQRAKELDVTIAQVNMSEKQAFLNGQKMVAIISEAASSGISLQADRRVPNRARRVHITLELPWSADEALQQLGRSHRSNQTSAPEYKLLMTKCGGERRFAAQLAKRLQALGALTKGHRHAADASQLSSFDYQTDYGKRALTELIISIRSREPSQGRLKSLFEAVLGKDKTIQLLDSGDYSDWNAHCAEVEETLMLMGLNLNKGNDISFDVKRFLNRLLGVQVDRQNATFAHFAAIFDDLVSRDKSEGTFDNGVVDVKANSIAVQRKVPFYTDPTTKARSCLYTLDLDRGRSWESALAELEAANKLEDEEGNADHINGFYESKNFAISLGCKAQHLIIRKRYQYGVVHQNRSYEMYRVIRPNMGLVHARQRAYIEENFRKYNISGGGPLSAANLEKAKKAWTKIFQQTERSCLHPQPCKSGHNCTYGSRLHSEALVVGCILSLWNAIEHVVMKGNRRHIVQVTRIRLSDGQRLVGVKFPHHRLKHWRQDLLQANVHIDEDADDAINLMEQDVEQKVKLKGEGSNPAASEGVSFSKRKREN